MSVDQTNILMYGVNIQFDEFTTLSKGKEDEWWDSNSLGNRNDQNVGFLDDGMNGGYCLIGRELYRSDSYSDPGVPFKVDSLCQEEKQRVKEGIEEFLGHDVSDLNYFFVSHYW